MNTFGEPFAADLEADARRGCRCSRGRPAREGEVARRYRRFVELLAPLGETAERVVTAVVLTPRFAWQLRLADGLDLELGRDGAEPVEQQLARFVAAYPESLRRLPRRAGSAADTPRYVDLRYPNGFALRVAGWKG